MGDKKQEFCKICGGPTPPGRYSVCSEACHEKAHKASTRRYRTTQKYRDNINSRRESLREQARVYKKSPIGQAALQRYKERRHQRVLEARALIEPRQCVVCTIEFTPKSALQKTCGAEPCQIAWHRQVSAKYMREHHPPTGRPHTGRPKGSKNKKKES